MSQETLASAAAAITAKEGYKAPAAWGLGLAHYHSGKVGSPAADDAPVLDTWFPQVSLGEDLEAAAIIADAVGNLSGAGSATIDVATLKSLAERFSAVAEDGHSMPAVMCKVLIGAVEKAPSHQAPAGAVVTFIGDLNDEAADAYDVYLRLHLLSHRKIQPHGCNLNGIFGKLANVAWTNQGPFLADSINCLRGQLKMIGEQVEVRSVDKFPRMTDYVVPGGVRIGDADRVRLGAHLAEGTTIMHEGFVNFNAGTLGHSMVEGRISAGVVVGDGSDVGGGASIMGTLSGGGKEVIKVGERSLLGANSGLGISLGDDCTIEAGLYVTAGSKVTTLWNGEVVKAGSLSNTNGLLFRRNSQSGVIEVVAKKNEAQLNEALHAN